MNIAINLWERQLKVDKLYYIFETFSNIISTKHDELREVISVPSRSFHEEGNLKNHCFFPFCLVIFSFRVNKHRHASASSWLNREVTEYK